MRGVPREVRRVLKAAVTKYGCRVEEEEEDVHVSSTHAPWPQTLEKKGECAVKETLKTLYGHEFNLNSSSSGASSP